MNVFHKWRCVTIVVCLWTGLITGLSAQSRSAFKSLIDEAYDSSMNGSFSGAITLLKKAQALKDIDTGYNDSYNLYLGNNYESLGQMDSAIYYYGEAIKHFESRRDASSLAFIYNRLGTAEINFTRRYKAGIDYFEKQIRYCLEIKDSLSLWDAYNNIGIAFKLHKDYDSSLAYFNKVIHRSGPASGASIRAHIFMGDTYSLQQDYDKALNYYNKAIQQLLPLQDSFYLYTAYVNKGDCLMKQNHFRESLECFEKAGKYINPSIEDNNKKELYHNLAFVYSNLGDYRKAYYYQSQESDLRDKINTFTIQKAAAEAEAKYEVRRSQDSLLLSKQQLALADSQARNQQRNFIIALITATALALLAFLAYRNARVRKRMHNKLAIEKQKADALAQDLNEANQTKTQLFSIISHDLRSPVSSLYAYLKLQEIRTETASNSEASQQVTHLLDTLEDLLIWSKSQMQQFTLQPVTVSISELFSELSMLYSPLARTRDLQFIREYPEELTIITDENLLKTIFRNLLSNALQYSLPGSSILLQTRKTEKGIICSITNTATPEDFTRMKEQFSNSSPDVASKGLGLFLTMESLKKLKGTLDLSYENGNILLQLYFPSRL